MKFERRQRSGSILMLICFLWSAVFAEALQVVERTPQGEQQHPSPNEAFVMVEGVAEHRIGRNDVLRITVWNGATIEETRVRVAEDGTIFAPFEVNRTLRVVGLSSTGLKRLMQQELLNNTQEPVVQIVIEEYNSRHAYLLGEIGIGGMGTSGTGLYPLEGRKSVLEFIIQHGGFTEEANLARVQINRASGEVLTLNLSDVIFQGDESQNPIVNPGDVVWVPSKEVGANTYYVLGEVHSPGVVTSEEDLSLVDVISRSGGFTADAERQKVFIARENFNQPELLQSDLKSLVEKADFSQNTALQNGDVIFVARRGLAKYREVIAVISPLLGLLRDTVFLIDRR